MRNTSVDQGQERVFCLLLVVQDTGGHIYDLEHLPFLVIHEELFKFDLNVPLLLLTVVPVQYHEDLVLQGFLWDSSEVKNAELIPWHLCLYAGGSILLRVIFA